MKTFITILSLLLATAATGYDFGAVNFKEAKYNEGNNSIDITYDLTAARHNYFSYAVDLYYSLDGGQTFAGPLRLVRGDVGGNVQPGPGKNIQWDYSIEAPDFTGNNIQFSIRAKARMRPEHYSKFGGPGNAAWSLLLPGLGDQKVQHQNKYLYYGFTVAAVGTVGAGIQQYLKAQDTYQEYLLAESTENANALYDQSQQQLKNSKIFFAAAAAIWVADITLVTIRGFKNQKLIRDTFPKAAPVSVALSMNVATPGVGLTMRFNHIRN